jgi:hypothetical protein
MIFKVASARCADRTQQRGVPTSIRNNRCGVAFARIANARS